MTDEQRFQASVKRFKESHQALTAQQRLTKRLGDDCTFVVSHNGKRLREEEARRTIQPPTALAPPCHVDLTGDEDDEEMMAAPPLAVYPPGRGGISLYPDDVDSLKGSAYLTDNVINVYLRWVYQETLTPQQQTATRVVDSHVTEQLLVGVTGGEHPVNEQALQSNIQRMAGWFPEKDPFGKDVTIIPICHKSHWFMMAVIRASGETYLLSGDSISRNTSGLIIYALLQFWRQTGEHRQECKTVRLNVKEQENAYDCGLHLIHNASKLMQALHPATEAELTVIEGQFSLEPCPITRNQDPDQLTSIIAAPVVHDRLTDAERDGDRKPVEADGISPTTDHTTQAREQADLRTEEVPPEVAVVLEVSPGQVAHTELGVLDNRCPSPWRLTAADVRLLQSLHEETARKRGLGQPRPRYGRRVQGHWWQVLMKGGATPSFVTRREAGKTLP